MQAYVESPIYARTNGYLVRWYKDIGSHVHKGDLLADIDTPEVDQELLQTRAARQQVVAQMDLAKINADRYQALRVTDSVSQQEADTQSSAYQQSVANLAAADANVKRLEQLEGFKHVYAPFDGVLTKRNVDPGTLINAGNSGATGQELFDIARTDPLRVFVSVPQAYAPAIKVGMKAVVTLQEFPEQKFLGTVARTADAIDPNTRTLYTEVDVPNQDGKLLPGSFGEVHFDPHIDANKVTIPVNAMLFREPRSAGRRRRQRRQGSLAPHQHRPRLRHHAGGPGRRRRQRSDRREPVRLHRRRAAGEHQGRKSGRPAVVKRLILAIAMVACGFLAGCEVGPNYKRPPAPAPEAYKTQAPWRVADPKDSLPKGAWWEVFNDAELNNYEQQLLKANQSLLAAKATWSRHGRWLASPRQPCSRRRASIPTPHAIATPASVLRW